MEIFNIIHYLTFYEDDIHIILHYQVYFSSSDSKVFVFTTISMRFIENLSDIFSFISGLFSVCIILHDICIYKYYFGGNFVSPNISICKTFKDFDKRSQYKCNNVTSIPCQISSFSTSCCVRSKLLLLRVLSFFHSIPDNASP